MAKTFGHSALLVLVFLSILSEYSEQLQSSQVQTLLRLKQLLNSPAVLSSWTNDTDFCNTEPSPSVTVVCYDKSITQLLIIGEKGTPPLPHSFSIDSFFTTLVKIPTLKVLTLVSIGLWGPLPSKIARLSSLEIFNVSSNFISGAIPQEISSLTNIQTLILDDNMFNGQLPHWLSSLSVLSVLSLKRNSLEGVLPESLGSLENLRILDLSHNHFLGQVPDLSSLTSLQVLDLENNSLGPQFPHVNKKIVFLVLRNNKFSSGIPSEVSSYYQLQKLDISLNRFVGPFTPSLLGLPSITYLSISGNRFTGMLFENLSCNSGLEYVDLSSNLLTGKLPDCFLSNSKDLTVLYFGNCLNTGDKSQHQFSFCRNEALAVGILPHRRKREQTSKIVLAFSISGGIIGGIALVGLAFVIARRVHLKQTKGTVPPRSIAESASTGYSSKLMSEARYVSQATRLGALGLPAYRMFSLEELEEATDSFDTSTFLDQGSHGQMYRGRMKDGSFVAIRCLKMKRSQTTQSFMHYIELISKLRHRHLVSALGHCFECYLDDSSVSRLFLVFEFVPNRTLRSWVSSKPTHILLYLGFHRVKHEEKSDVYDFGVILLEIIMGRPLDSTDEVDVERDQLQRVITADNAARRSAVDPAIHNGYADESVKTMMEICIRCLVKDPVDRPSIEDVLWNLQFAAQVQDAWHGDTQSSDGSPVSLVQPPHRQRNLQ
ncbi:hypothetical protein RHGRI_006735 [Rhododendron griersonianum]|uniref:Protein kinase domain-containing protein n=1 Tax=Rhododendron griersonianum TaxID=479676 RepID=A0AAV6KVN3_9ERIC|nr:hypothetical protein RHGRI_006735 [Rhododendron griersonianum]